MCWDYKYVPLCLGPFLALPPFSGKKKAHHLFTPCCCSELLVHAHIGQAHLFSSSSWRNCSVVSEETVMQYGVAKTPLLSLILCLLPLWDVLLGCHP